MPKKILFAVIAILAVILLVLAGVLLGMKLLGSKNPAGPSEYSAVYLSTGDIYFGKLDWFPWPRLTDVWFIERGQGQSGQDVALAQLKNVFWAPMDEIYLNPKEIVFWTRLRNDSQVVSALEGSTSGQATLPPSALRAIPQSSNPAPSPAGASQ